MNDFERHNKDLKTILDVRDKEAEMAKTQEAIGSKSAIDNAICRFYLNAAQLFKLLLASWNCTCPEHSAKLQLQHRATLTQSDFRLLFATSKDCCWELHHIQISQSNDTVIGKGSQYVAASCEPKLQPGHRGGTPVKSAMRGRPSQAQPKRVELLRLVQLHRPCSSSLMRLTE